MLLLETIRSSSLSELLSISPTKTSPKSLMKFTKDSSTTFKTLWLPNSTK